MKSLAAILVAALALAGCNTMEGLGEDVQAGPRDAPHSSPRRDRFNSP